MSEILTPREQEIHDLLLAGSTPKEIAYTLNITYETVKVHQKSVYKKLDVKNINEFIAKFKKNANDSDLWKENVRPVLFTKMIPFKDSNSTIEYESLYEEIEGKVVNSFNISGVLSDIAPVFVGVNGMPDDLSLKGLRTMKSMSFKVLGDGKSYHFKLATDETKGSADHYLFPFDAEKDKISNIIINVPDDLARACWSGLDEEFIQSNILFTAIQPVYFGPYRLKFWDFKLYR